MNLDYRTRAIISRSQFEATIVYKPQHFFPIFHFFTNKKQCPIYCSEKWGKEIEAVAYSGARMVDISFLNYS